jgi:dGTPase
MDASSPKHSTLGPTRYFHFEAQPVRLAGKISYFGSNLEDGTRLSAITASNPLSCRFFNRVQLKFGYY